MVLVVLLDQVLLDAPGLEEVDGLAVREGVRQGGDTAVGVDGQEPGLLLRVLADVDVGHLVGEAELLERDGDLETVGRLRCVEVDVGTRHGGGGDLG